MTTAPQNGAYRPDCWECRQRNAHAGTGGVHPAWWCKPDLCPDRAKHAKEVYGDRLTERYGGMTRDGVSIVLYIDGKKASVTHTQSRCICGLLLIWEPKKPAHANAPSH